MLCHMVPNSLCSIFPLSTSASMGLRLCSRRFDPASLLIPVISPYLISSLTTSFVVRNLIYSILAYAGPIVEVLGNVKNGYWQYKAVDDLMGPIQNLLLLA